MIEYQHNEINEAVPKVLESHCERSEVISYVSNNRRLLRDFVPRNDGLGDFWDSLISFLVAAQGFEPRTRGL